jgi:hypothetical protein
MASPQASATDSASGSGSKKQGNNLDDMLMWLGIDEDEIVDLVFEGEEDFRNKV